MSQTFTHRHITNTMFFYFEHKMAKKKNMEVSTQSPSQTPQSKWEKV